MEVGTLKKTKLGVSRGEKPSIYYTGLSPHPCLLSRPVAYFVFVRQRHSNSLKILQLSSNLHEPTWSGALTSVADWKDSKQCQIHPTHTASSCSLPINAQACFNSWSWPKCVILDQATDHILDKVGNGITANFSLLVKPREASLIKNEAAYKWLCLHFEPLMPLGTF